MVSMGQEFRKGLIQQFFPTVAIRQWLELPTSSGVSGTARGWPSISLPTLVLSPCGLVGLPHSTVALGQLDCFHGSSELQCQYARNEAEAACFLQPSLRNHTESPSLCWLWPNQKPAQVHGKGTWIILLERVSMIHCKRGCGMCAWHAW